MLVGGCVDTWHSYRPASDGCTCFITNVQFCKCRMCSTKILSFALCVVRPTVNRVGTSCFLVQDTCSEMEVPALTIIMVSYFIFSRYRKVRENYMAGNTHKNRYFKNRTLGGCNHACTIVTMYTINGSSRPQFEALNMYE